MPLNKNATIRYQALDKCFSDFRHRYYIDDLIDACAEALIEYTGHDSVSRRTVFEDITKVNKVGAFRWKGIRMGKSVL